MRVATRPWRLSATLPPPSRTCLRLRRRLPTSTAFCRPQPLCRPCLPQRQRRLCRCACTLAGTTSHACRNLLLSLRRHTCSLASRNSTTMALLPHATPPFARRLTSSGAFCVCVDAVRKSSSVRGMCCTLLRTRAATRQRRPLTVSVVMELEKAVAEDEGRGEPDAVVAGAAFSAVWVGDLRRCIKEPGLDLTEGVGFLKTHITDHKTSPRRHEASTTHCVLRLWLDLNAVGPFVVASSRRSWPSRRSTANGVACNGQVWAVVRHRLHHARALRSLQEGPSSKGLQQ